MTREQKRQYWLNHIKAWQASDLSQTDYARLHNLSAKAFNYHKRRHCKAPAENRQVQSVVPVVVETSEINTAPLKSGITLSMPQGVKVELEPGFNADCLKRLLEVLA